MDATANPIPKTLVLGLGNALLSDLGAGIEVVHRLRRRRPRPATIDPVRVGLINISLAELIGQYTGLIVVESRPIGGTAGAIVELQGAGMDAFLNTQTGDDASLADILGVLRQDGRVPQQRALMLVQPGSARVGHGLSRPVNAALPEVIDRIVERAHTFGIPSRAASGMGLADTLGG